MRYKSPKYKSGVYRIVNTVTGKMYIGASTDIWKRLWSHQTSLNTNKHPNKELQEDWNKYGSSVFFIQGIRKMRTFPSKVMIEAEYEEVVKYPPSELYNKMNHKPYKTIITRGVYNLAKMMANQENFDLDTFLKNILFNHYLQYDFIQISN